MSNPSLHKTESIQQPNRYLYDAGDSPLILSSCQSRDGPTDGHVAHAASLRPLPRRIEPRVAHAASLRPLPRRIEPRVAHAAGLRPLPRRIEARVAHAASLRCVTRQIQAGAETTQAGGVCYG
jgi:hypothetical protein